MNVSNGMDGDGVDINYRDEGMVCPMVSRVRSIFRLIMTLLTKTSANICLLLKEPRRTKHDHTGPSQNGADCSSQYAMQR